MSDETSIFGELIKCPTKITMYLLPAIQISSRELNKLSESELNELLKMGLSSVGYAGIGMRSAVYPVINIKNLPEIIVRLKEKGIKYKLTKAFHPICVVE
ncbi:hypothetical protein DRO24_01380 [Candidatus Bathyarchaeota archaeon]|nr:MAG: hypothetical protein DRO24_01380 [Candidatus Bathyarchaeota archaeon]